MEFHHDGHPILQEGAAVAQQFRRQFDLLIGFGVHEHQHSILLIEKLLVFLFKTHAFNLVSRAETLVQFAAIAQIAHLDLSKSAALTGLHVIHFYSGPQTAIMFQNISGTNFIAVDFRHIVNPSKP